MQIKFFIIVCETHSSGAIGFLNTNRGTKIYDVKSNCSIGFDSYTISYQAKSTWQLPTCKVETNDNEMNKKRYVRRTITRSSQGNLLT